MLLEIYRLLTKCAIEFIKSIRRADVFPEAFIQLAAQASLICRLPQHRRKRKSPTAGISEKLRPIDRHAAECVFRRVDVNDPTVDKTEITSVFVHRLWHEDQMSRVLIVDRHR